VISGSRLRVLNVPDLRDGRNAAGMVTVVFFYYQRCIQIMVVTWYEIKR
jgi:hypothetical protein